MGRSMNRGRRVVARFAGLVAGSLVLAGIGVASRPLPAEALFCYTQPSSAIMDWEWNGSDAIMDWGSGDLSFNPVNSAASAVLDGPKAPNLDANNTAVAGWTARSRAGTRYGGQFSNDDAEAQQLGEELFPCTS